MINTTQLSLEASEKIMVIVRLQIEKLINGKDFSTVEAYEIESYLLSLGVQAYELGKEYALENLLTTKQLAEKLGLQVSQTGKLARKRGVGRKLEGYLRVYLPEDISKMEERKVGRPFEKGKR